jgi:hypothetical protein
VLQWTSEVAGVGERRREAAEKLDGGQVKGTMLLAHLRWFERQAGEGGQERLASHAPRVLAEALRQTVMPIGWYPFRALIELDRTIAGLLDMSADRVARELGRSSAEQNLTIFYKAFQRGDPHAFFRQEALLHDRFLDFGQAVYAPHPGGAGTIRLFGYPCCSRLFCLSAEGYYQRAAEMMGGRSVVVREITCQCFGEAACEFSFRWK